MPKGQLCLFFKGSQAKSSHREAYVVNEGQPSYVFLALVPILPTDQWHFVTRRYQKSLLHVGVCVWVNERERDVHIDFNSWQSVLVFDVFVYIECKYVWNWNKKKERKNCSWHVSNWSLSSCQLLTATSGWWSNSKQVHILEFFSSVKLYSGQICGWQIIFRREQAGFTNHLFLVTPTSWQLVRQVPTH